MPRRFWLTLITVLRRRADCDIAMAEPAAHGAVNESAARTASGFGRNAFSREAQGSGSLSRVGGYRRIMRGIFVPGFAMAVIARAGFAHRSGDFGFFCALWTGALISAVPDL